jgi:hypothetical protein
MDRKTKTLRERVLEYFKVLGIPVTPEELDHVVAEVERDGSSFLEGLDRLLGEQAARRRPLRRAQDARDLRLELQQDH